MRHATSKFQLKSLGLFIAMMWASFPLVGQQVQSLNLPRYDQRQWHFGFILGSQMMEFNYRSDVIWPEGVYGVEVIQQPGYNVGIVTNLHLGETADLRFVPTYSAGERTLLFDAIDPSDSIRKNISRRIESSLIVFPLELKLKTERIGNHRWYVLGGAYAALDLASKAKVVDDRIFKLQPADYGFEVALGIDMYFEYFKFSPQYRFTFGQGNISVPDGTPFANALPMVNTRFHGIVLTFE